MLGIQKIILNLIKVYILNNINKIIEKIGKELDINLKNYETSYYNIYLQFRNLYLGKHENISDYNKYINDYNIIDESFLKLNLNRKPWTYISVLTFKNKKEYIISPEYLDKTSTKDLKYLIEDEYHIPENEQILIYKGNQLEDNEIAFTHYIPSTYFNIIFKAPNDNKYYFEYEMMAKNKEKQEKIDKNNLKSFYNDIKIEEPCGGEKTKNMINIFVENKIGKTIFLASESNTIIRDIKYQIKEKFILDLNICFSLNQLILHFNDTILENNKTLSYYNIKNESTIILKINMNIFIEFSNENLIILKVQPEETIEDIKIKIKNQEDIPIDQQKDLYFCYKKIENDKLTLLQLEIQNYSILKFYEIKEIINVQMINGKIIKIPIPNSFIPVQVLKSFIENQEGISSDTQRLIYQGKVLYDYNPIFEYDIHGGDTIYLTLKLR